MVNPFKILLNKIAEHFSKDASKMLVWTGVIGWALSSAAQIGALIINPKLTSDQKSFLIPQELADAAVNIGAFFLITQFTKKTVAKLFSTGKIAPKSVRIFLNKDPKIKNEIGKVTFDIDEYMKSHLDKFPKESYYTTKNYFTGLATVGAGILSSNIVTPIVRNSMASDMQKKYINNKKQIETKPLMQKTSGIKI